MLTTKDLEVTSDAVQLPSTQIQTKGSNGLSGGVQGEGVLIPPTCLIATPSESTVGVPSIVVNKENFVEEGAM